MNEGYARVAREGGYWFLKLGGDLRHPLGPALDALLDRAFAEPGYAGFALDLSEAENIDSTCLGILARIGIRASETGQPRPPILGAGADLREILLAMCFERIFCLADAGGAAAEGLEPLAEIPAEEGAMLALVLDAHRRLCELDSVNREAFRDLLEVLERDAQRRARGKGQD